jgi:hypothetical protein
MAFNGFSSPEWAKPCSSKSDSISPQLGASANVEGAVVAEFGEFQAATAEADFLPPRHQDTKKCKNTKAF